MDHTRPILTSEEEGTLVNWIITSSRKGFSRCKEDVILCVKEFLILNERPNQFKDNTPGIRWYKAFFQRHPEISTRTSESVTSASSCV
ncbi:hypothetical protein ANN_26373 [Periplaneta americana]|uniref:HTH CENPB-type domain-containing protein n=1 Tax=Periplaneta americana TaxID=6978 RepID=A0ABQ8RY68_PERAM|nr:hypothetical protein ANN_26373 [Periplaneta americana]